MGPPFLCCLSVRIHRFTLCCLSERTHGSTLSFLFVSKHPWVHPLFVVCQKGPMGSPCVYVSLISTHRSLLRTLVVCQKTPISYSHRRLSPTDSACIWFLSVRTHDFIQCPDGYSPFIVDPSVICVTCRVKTRTDR